MKREPMEIYIHIPFCVKKCQYCDFLSFGIDDEKLKEYKCCPNEKNLVPEVYIESLCREIRWYGQKEEYRHRPVISVFFGGGTPSLMSELQLLKIMAALRENFYIKRNAEISMEANPGTLTLEKLQWAKRVGINRLSLGLQSANGNELKIMGRIHSYDTFLQCYQWAREAGFKNINVDVITALPDQTEASYKNTLEKIIKLEPEHISAYSLIIEPGTPFEKLEEEGKLNLPDEEEERRMYEDTRMMLERAGYHRYEISNYSKPGYECRHNTGYWRRIDYLGLGLGASSLADQRRFSNTDDLPTYIEGKYQEESWYADYEVLEKKTAMEEFMFLGLRMTSGIREKDFEIFFGEKIMHVYGKVIHKYVMNGLLKRRNGRICLTNKGLDVANTVMSDFLL